MFSIYIHIPFCQSKCKYCAFATFPMEEKTDYVEQYLQAFECEAARYAQVFAGQQVRTLYFG
ncbi:MAG: hypothetical protein Q4B28_04700 [bacterium]|nr:hypothetical protein [bacterium]